MSNASEFTAIANAQIAASGFRAGDGVTAGVVRTNGPTPGTTIFELSEIGRGTARFALPTDANAALERVPKGLRRANPAGLPEVSEPELVRHYVRLSQRNYNIDTGFYPLGSCTMKYNPKVNEQIAAMPGFAQLHPLQDPADSQGTLQVLWELQNALCELSGLEAVTLQPAAGAHGEFTGLMIMRAHHEQRVVRGEIAEMPTHVLIPDTAHGTNPASVTMAGFKTVAIRTNKNGGMDIDDVRAKVAEYSVVGLMLTNPSTLGLFDQQIAEIAAIVHDAGGLLYYDGANFNAIMGRTRPGDMGFDIVHFNTHKTFSTPHGGGGPGAGPVAVTTQLAQYLPVPTVVQRADAKFDLEFDLPLSIGHIKQFWGNVGVLVRAWAYIRTHGRDGLTRVSDIAVLNANYVLARLSPAFDKLYGRLCMHELVISAADLKRNHGIRALDIAKRLIDYGFHPPTVYFPLLVEEALMIEPTETESKETLDRFADALLKIVDEARTMPEVLTDAPTTAPVRRIDEARAVRNPVLHFVGDGVAADPQDPFPNHIDPEDSAAPAVKSRRAPRFARDASSHAQLDGDSVTALS